MNKRLLSLLLIFGLALNISGCTSGGGKDEAEVAEANDETFAEEGEGDFAEESSGDESTEETSDDTQVAESSDDAAPEDEGEDLSIDDEGEEVAETEEAPVTEEVAATDGLEGEDELSLDDEALPEDVAATEEAPITETDAAAPTDVAAAPEATDEPVFEESAPTEEAAETTEVAASEPPVLESNPPPSTEQASFLPLLKVRDSAYAANDGTNLNRVYFARPGESTNEISQKLYGSDRSRDLKKWNPYLSARPAKAGDKIYYSSPTNAADNRMLTFYEEQNIPAQTYVSKQGDNIRSVSKDLLGFDGAWKEVWATNASVESKGDISEGIELKYWPEGSAPVPVTTAATETAPPPEMPSELPPPTQAQAPMPDPGADPFAQQPGSELPPDVAANDPLAPPPLPDSAAVGSVGGVPSDTMEPPPPPPMPAEPKPVVKRAAPDAMEGTDEEAMDADTTMALGVAGLLILAAAALVIFIRKNRTKKLDMTQTTQI